jgi:poly-beta-1,6-N-acetyl-D-glucosamine synthase
LGNSLTYVIITPAHNEERFIENTIQSMVVQTHRPVKWVIVSDGSTDRTDEIVKGYIQKHSWIDLIRMPEHRDHQFAAKAQAFNAGYGSVSDIQYNVIGNLDADITFEKDYFEFLLLKFKQDPALGVAGTPFVEDGSHYDYRFTNIEHVSGACQLFRRECFEHIGGYIPIKGGGVDWAAVTTARMKGWKARTFTEKSCVHHRPMGTGGRKGEIQRLFRHGRKDYFLGGHPLWQIFRGFYQMTRSPYIIGGMCLLAGYYWALLTRIERMVSPDLIRFHRAEQMARLKAFAGKSIGLSKVKGF